MDQKSRQHSPQFHEGAPTCRIWDATMSIEELVANAHCGVSRELTAEEHSTWATTEQIDAELS
jgi:hypothetical protein